MFESAVIPTVMSKDILKFAIIGSALVGKIREEDADATAEHMLSFLGYDNSVLDNLLKPADRTVFYEMEDNGLVTTLREETTLNSPNYEGNEWRMSFWMIHFETLYKYAEKGKRLMHEEKIEKTADAPEDPYSFYETLSWTGGKPLPKFGKEQYDSLMYELYDLNKDINAITRRINEKIELFEEFKKDYFMKISPIKTDTSDFDSKRKTLDELVGQIALNDEILEPQHEQIQDGLQGLRRLTEEESKPYQRYQKFSAYDLNVELQDEYREILLKCKEVLGAAKKEVELDYMENKIRNLNETQDSICIVTQQSNRPDMKGAKTRDDMTTLIGRFDIVRSALKKFENHPVYLRLNEIQDYVKQLGTFYDSYALKTRINCCKEELKIQEKAKIENAKALQNFIVVKHIVDGEVCVGVEI